jgi:hypothetical protein
MKLPVAQRLNFTLSHDKERDILKRELENAIQHAQDNVEKAFPEGLPMMDKPAEPEVRFERYVMVTAPEDYVLLEQDDYVAKFKRGEVPPHLSPFWKGLMLFPDMYSAMRTDFRRLLKDRQ